MGEWYTLANASRKIGKNEEYFTTKYRLKPSMFDGVEMYTMGGVIFVSEKGLELLKTRVKKRDVHQKPRIFSGLQKQENTLLFPPTSILSHIV